MKRYQPKHKRLTLRQLGREFDKAMRGKPSLYGSKQ